ncbi:Vesicle tethering p115-lik protein [Drechmeria coniospora]|uniref:Vesicle tethering p115-lik protein n=1 Tax=Drechmeria coniospora TaxID=98403 RepID=A0A151GG12_DRECN|nr:Vesicle tethering p115-lik protein [Drechmeria coniospora]KYK56043.1 Vesicle tethering p115-lik protein [Drechmeria coniospora]ODA76544.1 hypothetical protein RJ55_07814 [Drechmeria coniospora]
MFSITTAPAKQQSVSDTITILSGRLSSATLLEDRRAAIQGLRSFSKDFPASVASGALRSLIGCLGKDGEDLDTVKVVLETLLMLFNPNDDSPEASDEIVLWLADEFTQRQENITLLLNFLENADFYARLYSLQLLAAILAARTQRTEECVFTAPHGISRLVAVLGDDREAIRNEAIGFLIALTPTSTEIQKLVAFENAFEMVFAIIDADGSLSEGGRTVEDCLIFLANLLRSNPSNQALFRETGLISKLNTLLKTGLVTPHPDGADIAAWAQVQRNRNIYAFLAVIRLFLQSGSVGVLQNQTATWKHGLLYSVLQLGFSAHFDSIPIKAEALLTCGDMIRNARALQESFAQLTVPTPIHEALAATSSEQQPAPETTYVIDGLLDLILNTHDQRMFDLRFAACECLKAYLSNHAEVRLHFLSRAIDGYQEGPHESANILSVLLRPTNGVDATDPYRQWFAAVIAFHLLHDNIPAKAKVLAVTEGDSEHGEEVVTSIQTVTAHLISGISRGDDARMLVGHLMLLLGWMFEDMDAVNDFLADGSNVQSLIQAVIRPFNMEAELVQGLSAMLLGVAYEFSTKDSPIPRTTLHSILTSRLGRDKYLDRLASLRCHPLIRDFEVLSHKQDASSPGGLPRVFFDAAFVDFLKDNYNRIARAIDRSPEFEISVVANGVEKGISRELVDSLRQQVEEKERALQDATSNAVSLQSLLEQKQAESSRVADETARDMAQHRSSREALQKSHEAEMSTLRGQMEVMKTQQEAQIASIRAEMAAKEAGHQNRLDQTRGAAQQEAERLQRRLGAEAADLRATISRLEVDLVKVNKSKTDDMNALREENAKLLAEQVARGDEAAKLARQLESQIELAERKVAEMDGKLKAAQSSASDAIESKDTTQGELDDLLIVFADLEEKVERYSARLRELGDPMTDGEDEGPGDEGD